MVKQSAGVEGLTRTVKIYEQGWVDRTVEEYLTRAGVGEPVMTLLRKTPAASIRWLRLDEIRAAGLATAALDPARPIVIENANGLGGAFDDGRPLLLTVDIAGRQGSRGGFLTLSYRKGGGALELTLNEAGKPAQPPIGWTLAVGAAEPLTLRQTGSSTGSALLPRVRFCALGRAGSIIATPSLPGAAADGPVAFDLATETGAQAIFDEACP